MSEECDDGGVTAQDAARTPESAGAALRDALRGALADLTPGLAGIRTQLDHALGELRRGNASPLAVALENLQGFFALLAQMGESFEGRTLPELDRFDAAIQDGVAALDRLVAEGRSLGALADRVQALLLPAVDSWPPVAAELESAVEAVDPGESGAPA